MNENSMSAISETKIKIIMANSNKVLFSIYKKYTKVIIKQGIAKKSP